jgi:hypothetical protein
MLAALFVISPYCLGKARRVERRQDQAFNEWRAEGRDEK